MPSFLRLQPTVRYGATHAIHNLSVGLFFVLFVLIGAKDVRAAPITIAALGDSLVHGYGLAPADGFVPQLEAWLDQQGVEIALINAGVSGDTTAGGLSRVGWALTPDVDALIVSLGGNDALRGVDPAAVRKNLDGILTLATARSLPILIIGIEAPGNFGADYLQDFQAIYPDLAEKYGTLLYPNFLQALMDLRDRQDTLDVLFQADGIHPNANGIAVIVGDMGPSVVALVDLVQNGG